MVEIKRVIKAHPEVMTTCPNCGTPYILQNGKGGQKGGASPVVHVKEVGEAGIGYCSPECMWEANGWDLQGLLEMHQRHGTEPNPPGYLAPARIKVLIRRHGKISKIRIRPGDNKGIIFRSHNPGEKSL